MNALVLALLVALLAGCAGTSLPLAEQQLRRSVQFQPAAYDITGTIGENAFRARLTLADSAYSFRVAANTCTGTTAELSDRINNNQIWIACHGLTFTFRVEDGQLTRAVATREMPRPPRQERICVTWDQESRCQGYETQLVPQLPAYRDYRLTITAVPPG